MNDEKGGLARSLGVGDYVVLSTGAVARTRRPYAAGYAGVLELELDGQEMSERAEGLTLPEPDRVNDREVTVTEVAAADEHLVREHDHRMKD